MINTDGLELPHAPPSSHPGVDESKFSFVTDEKGRMSVMHNGPNRAQRQQMKAIKRQAFKNGMARFKRQLEKAKKQVAVEMTPRGPAGIVTGDASAESEKTEV